MVPVICLINRARVATRGGWRRPCKIGSSVYTVRKLGRSTDTIIILKLSIVQDPKALNIVCAS
jgi:hypothetical protein